MAQISFKGNPIHTNGELPQVGTKAPEFELTATDLSAKSLKDYAGKNVVLNIFPSVDTGICAQSVRTFNQELSALENTVVLCISKDLPFAFSRFCAAEGLDDVVSLSAFKDSSFEEAYGVKMTEGPLAGLLSRAVVVIDTEGNVVYTEQVPEIAQEPSYEGALASIKG
jgi:thioredoxin-dependent peroxiredoxin